jgi:hypothetical protein
MYKDDLTRHWSRRLTALAPLPLSGAAHRQRWADLDGIANGKRRTR